MKIKKVVNLFLISVPIQTNDSSFFQGHAVDKLYFKSREEAELYQLEHYPLLQVTSSDLLAVEDKNKEGKDRWVTIKEVDDLKNPARDDVKYEVAPQLEDAMRKNPSSVIAVKELRRSVRDNYDGLDTTTIVYDGVDSGAAASRFLYVGKNIFNCKFVERGEEVNVIDAGLLVKRKQIRDLQQLQQQLAAEQARLEEEVHSQAPAAARP